MLRLLLGTDWTANRDAVLTRIARDVAQKKGNRILMVPELISHDMERRLCRAAGDTCSRYGEVLSFTRLARRVADSQALALEPCLDNGGRVVAMAAAVRQLSSRLKAYASVGTRPEFLTELVDGVDEFKRCRISPADLRAAAAQTQGSLAQKLEELSLVLEGYDGICARVKRDPRDQMSWLLEQMEAGDFGETHTFYIDGFPDFTRQHMAILDHLIRVSPSVTVSLNCDRPGSTAMAFEKAGHTARELLRRAKAAGIPVEMETVPPGPVALPCLRDRLFQGKIQPKPEGGVTAVRTGSVFQEVTAAAERIRALAASGCRYRDIAVVCADMSGYRSVVNLVFHRFGIPLYLSGAEGILEKSLVTTVLTAMDAAAGGFDRQQTLRYLRSVLSPLDPDTCDLVENYAIIWGIRGSRWLQEWTGHPDGLGREWDEESKERLSFLNAARRAGVEPLEKLGRGLREAENLAGQVRAVYGFLEDIQLDRRLEELAGELDRAGDNRSAQELNQLWEILLGALEQLYDVLGDTAWDTETFSRLLKLLLSRYDVGTIPTVLDAVTVGPVSAMRCQQCKHLLVLGAVEGALPAYGGSGGVLTDPERVALRKLGVPLTGGAMEGVQAEFAEIYGVFCGAGETVYVSCPEGQPSFLYRRLAEMAGGETWPETTLGAALADPREAGALLAALGDEKSAGILGLEEPYREIRARAAFCLGAVSDENVRAIYGRTLRLSASQVDCLAECRLRYFLKYGLRARERKELTVDPAEFGSYVHWVLEQTVNEIQKNGGFHQISLEDTLKIAMKYSESYARQRFSQLESERTAYLLRRNARELEMVVRELWQELEQAEFAPIAVELGFGGPEGQLPPVPIAGNRMAGTLQGKVDRVDLWEGPGGPYYRVVDYKTGGKDFDYCDVFNGVGLQMLIYLFALADGGRELLGNHPVGAGVQYFPARAPMVSAEGRLTDEEAEAARRKEWKRKGLLLGEEPVLQAMEPGESPRYLDYTRRKDGPLAGSLADRDQMKLLRRYVFRILGKLADEIASGRVDPNPYTRGTSHDACRYCPFGTVCHREAVAGRRNYKAMKPQEFWEGVEKEVSHG